MHELEESSLSLINTVCAAQHLAFQTTWLIVALLVETTQFLEVHCQTGDNRRLVQTVKNVPLHAGSH